MIYCMGDIHGNYKGYKSLLQQICFSDKDILYTIGDVVDRGEESMKVLLDMMMRPNVYPIMGNHDWMAFQCLKWFSQDITEESIAQLSEEKMDAVKEWFVNGGESTLREFRGLSAEQRELVMEYLGEFSLYEEAETESGSFLMLHGGLDNFSPERPLEDYTAGEIIWARCDYEKTYFPDKFLVTGHTPTRNIRSHLHLPMNDRIFSRNNHIAIDCGSGMGGLLGVICLDTFEEYYA